MLRCEPLEPRDLPATLFVITHGLQLNTDQVPDWTRDMATAISRRLGLGASADAVPDNYCQKVDPFPFGTIPGVHDDDGIMDGGVVAGALNVDLSAAVRAWAGRTGDFSSHYEARDWYHWTVDADDTDAATVRYL